MLLIIIYIIGMPVAYIVGKKLTPGTDDDWTNWDMIFNAMFSLFSWGWLLLAVFVYGFSDDSPVDKWLNKKSKL